MKSVAVKLVLYKIKLTKVDMRIVMKFLSAYL